MKKQKGPHTWDMSLKYHLCPRCGKIIESQDPYEYSLGVYIKELTCPRCSHTFTEKIPAGKTFGPLIGDPERPEFDWN